MTSSTLQRCLLGLLLLLATTASATAQTTATATVKGVDADLEVETTLANASATYDAQAMVEVTAPPASSDTDAAGSIFLEGLGLDLLEVDAVTVEADVTAPTPTSAELEILDAIVLGSGPATLSIEQLTASVDITGSCTSSLGWSAQVDLVNAEVDAGLAGSVDISGSAAANSTVYNDLGVQVTLNEQVVVESADSLDIIVRPVVVRVGGAVASLVTIDGRVQLGEIRVTVDCEQTEATSNLDLTQNGSPALVVPGENIAFDVTLTNLGPDTAPEAQVTFSLPDAFENTQLSPSTGTCSGGSCQVSNFANSASMTIGVSGTIAQDATGLLTWSASASSPNQDPDAQNDFVEASMATDRDGDGIPDSQDNCPDNVNPDQGDLDGDGIGDACDSSPGGQGTDTDQDGIPDEEDNCPFTPNFDQTDTNGDGIGDACQTSPTDTDGDGIPDTADNCPFTPNPDQADSNGNGIGDACEQDPDTDGDGVPDDEDNCPVTFNPSQNDVDDDGIGDACDPTDDSDPGEPKDTDKDGVPDDEDNCPTVINPGQGDADDDGIGDACDDTPPTNGPDIDGDGTPDEEDNCPRHHNPDQTDSDGDGIGDACDTTDEAGGEAACSQIFQGKELLLHDGRFRVTARWATALDAGFGDAVQLSQDSGYFTFFNVGNIELVVKVLDACDFNQRFWVSVAGLTDVEVDVAVVDTETGATWRYSNASKNLFDTTIDVGGLAVCQ